MADSDDITPPEGVPIPSVEQQARSWRARVRPGAHVKPPEVTDHEWLMHRRHQRERAGTPGPADDPDIDAAIEQARNLLRVARKPLSDATWPVIRDWLLDIKNELAERGHPDDHRKYLTVCALLKGDRNA